MKYLIEKHLKMEGKKFPELLKAMKASKNKEYAKFATSLNKIYTVLNSLKQKTEMAQAVHRPFYNLQHAHNCR
jgi:hypothetical protein